MQPRSMGLGITGPVRRCTTVFDCCPDRKHTECTKERRGPRKYIKKGARMGDDRRRFKLVDRLKEVDLTEDQREVLVDLIMESPGDNKDVINVFQCWTRVG